MFINKLNVILVLTNIFYYIASSAVESKGKRSMMEYMNDFFTPDNSEFLFKLDSNKGDPEITDNKHYRFSESRQDPAAANPANAKPANAKPANAKPANAKPANAKPANVKAPTTPNAKLTNATQSTEPKEPTEEELQKLVNEDWLMISSPLFNQAQVFPPIRLPEGKMARIHTDSENFRINDAFFVNAGDKPPTNREFWFRLSGLNIYYTVSKKDINILGAISIKLITNAVLDKLQIYVGNNATYCFTVWDDLNHDWKVCAYKQEVAQKWVCAIMKLLGNIPAECLAPQNKTEIEVIEKKITQPIIIIPLPSKYCNEDWNYQKSGDDWECDCKEGREQSPIDLPLKEKAIDSPVKPFFQYDRISPESPVNTIEGYQSKGQKINFQYLEGALKLIYHKIGKVVTLDGAIFYAQEIIFHTPAEHTIAGKKFEMEVQIVHYGQSVGDIARQVSLSFLVQKSPGVYNQFIDDFNVFNLPNPTDTKRNLERELYLPKIFFDKKEEESNQVAFWKPFSFYTYQGSLSFPPCTENTIVYVAHKPVRLGTTALSLFQEALRIPDMMNDATGDVIVSNWVTSSARKIQPTNGRPVFFYDHVKYCGPDQEEQKPPEEGHYEKVQSTITRYFYVNRDVPSGVPHSFVVSKNEATGELPKDNNADKKE